MKFQICCKKCSRQIPCPENKPGCLVYHCKCDNPNCECHQEEILCSRCKTNTLDKCEKYRHDFIYHEVNGIIDQRLCRKCNLNEKLPEKNWNNEPCGNKLCENCHPEIYSKVKPKGVGEWEDYICFKRPTKCVAKFQVIGCDGQVYVPQEINIQDLLLQEKAKWKGEIADKVRALDRQEVEEEGVIQDVLTLIDKL